MKNDFLVTALPVNHGIENQEAQEGGVKNSIARRIFLKRTGGAAVATLVAWNLQTLKARATGGGGGGSSWGMLCFSPDITQVDQAELILTNEVFGDFVISEMALVIETNKLKDDSEAIPYYTCPYNITVSLDINGSFSVGAPRPFSGNAGYWEDCQADLDPVTGALSWTSIDSSSVPQDVGENVISCYIEINGIYTLRVVLYVMILAPQPTPVNTIIIPVRAHAIVDLYDTTNGEMPEDPYEWPAPSDPPGLSPELVAGWSLPDVLDPFGYIELYHEFGTVVTPP